MALASPHPARPCELIPEEWPCPLEWQSRVVPPGWRCDWCARDCTAKRRLGGEPNVEGRDWLMVQRDPGEPDGMRPKGVGLA